jgi:uncharacterized protein GlcG (DUF336 family)
MQLSRSQSEAVIAAGAAEASAMGVPMNIAVLDSGTNLKAFLRMDGALLGSIDIALRKARTAALFGMKTEAVGEFCKPGGTSPGLENTNGGLVVFAGGVPLLAPDGALIGAVGISGGSVVQDAQVASAAAAAAAATKEGEEAWSLASPDEQVSSLQHSHPQAR